MRGHTHRIEDGKTQVLQKSSDYIVQLGFTAPLPAGFHCLREVNIGTTCQCKQGTGIQLQHMLGGCTQVIPKGKRPGKGIPTCGHFGMVGYRSRMRGDSSTDEMGHESEAKWTRKPASHVPMPIGPS